MSNWSAPDSKGIITLVEGFGERRTAKGRKRRRSTRTTPASLNLLPKDQKDILCSWLGNTSSRRKWATLESSVDFNQIPIIEELVEALLEAGWIETEERRDIRGWELMWISFFDLEELREELGLQNRNKQKQAADNLGSDFEIPSIKQAAESIATLPPATKISRHELLTKLDQWGAEGCQGTRRDFSLFARGRTKNVSSTEWNWLESVLDLCSLGVFAHTPQIKILIPGGLVYPEGITDFRPINSFVGMTKQGLCDATSFEGKIESWIVIENLTTFEHIVASVEPGVGVVWVPGFAPSWWVASVENLVRLTKAPAKIACDPDPAGLLITQQVASIWEKQGVEWTPWMMSPKDFGDAAIFLDQTDADSKILKDYAKNSHPKLQPLYQWLVESGKKLEQESFLN